MSSQIRAVYISSGNYEYTVIIQGKVIGMFEKLSDATKAITKFLTGAKT